MHLEMFYKHYVVPRLIEAPTPYTSGEVQAHHTNHDPAGTPGLFLFREPFDDNYRHSSSLNAHTIYYWRSLSALCKSRSRWNTQAASFWRILRQCFYELVQLERQHHTLLEKLKRIMQNTIQMGYPDRGSVEKCISLFLRTLPA